MLEIFSLNHTQAYLHYAASALIPFLLSLLCGLFRMASPQQASPTTPQCHLLPVGSIGKREVSKGKSPIFLGCSLPSLPGFYQMCTREVTKEQ